MSSSVKYCERCGTQNDIDAIFCSSCGSKLYEVDTPQTEPQAEPMAKPASQSSSQSASQPQPQTQWGSDLYNPQGQQTTWVFDESRISGLVDGSVKMVTNPHDYARQLVADPNAPSAAPIVILRALLHAFVIYRFFVDDRYFAVNFLDALQTAANQANITLAEARNAYTYMFPLISGLLLIAFWYIGSILVSLFVKGAVPNNSPILHNTARSMRQLFGYAQIPLISAELVSVIMVLSVNPTTYTMVMGIANPIGMLGFGIMVWRGFGKHTDYNGSFVKFIAGIYIFLAALNLLSLVPGLPF